jgi:hypothetical protein
MLTRPCLLHLCSIYYSLILTTKEYMHNITAIEPKVRGPTKAKGTRYKIEPASRLLVVDTSRTKSVQGR